MQLAEPQTKGAQERIQMLGIPIQSYKPLPYMLQDLHELINCVLTSVFSLSLSSH